MKKTFADKVKAELKHENGLGAIARQFNLWKYLVKKSPKQYRIYMSGSTFWLEEYQWCYENVWKWVRIEESYRGKKNWTSEWL